jgi:two-component sensor histidine kinase
MPNSLVEKHLNLSEAAAAFLQTIEQQMGIVADLSRADILIYGRKSPKELIVVAHAQPHSLAHVYAKSRAGRIVSIDHRPEILRALTTGRRQEDQRSVISEGAPVVRQTFPIYYPPTSSIPEMGPAGSQPSCKDKPEIIGALIIVTNLIEHERHRLRSKVFKRALKNLHLMLLAGQVIGAEALSPFGEQDGILIVDNSGLIQYASGIAVNLYRRVGYRETLAGRLLSTLETGDEELLRETLAQKRCLERAAEEGDRFWIRKTIPLISYPNSYWALLVSAIFAKSLKVNSVLITLHDDTETRRQDQELQVKNALIQEVHHRVKNNLQTIAGLLRMQMRRAQSEEARQVLEETLSRILSVAVIHEFLSSDSSNIINIKEVGNRIVSQLQYGMLSADTKIHLEVTGEPIYLPARQATSCALIINELVQNAIEHGFEKKKEGIVQVNLEDNGDEVIIKVADNGDGLPGDLDLEDTDSLGLKIVKILVEGDLKGQIQLGCGLDNGNGLSIKIIFSKNILRGEAGWKEHVSL